MGQVGGICMHGVDWHELGAERQEDVCAECKIREWAKDTAPSLTDEQWQHAERYVEGDVESAMLETLRNVHGTAGIRALLDSVEELAAGMSPMQRAAYLEDGLLVDPFGLLRKPTPLGRAVLRVLKAKHA